MKLKILLPYRVFSDLDHVISIIFETSSGLYGLLPQRLDCVAALVPGIFCYKTEPNETHYLAIGEGILIKAGAQVQVSIRNAFGAADLGQLSEMVKTSFKHQAETELAVHAVMAKLESGFMYRLNKFRK